MQKHTENFKKAVVKKVLIPGIQLKEIADKLNLVPSTIWRWKKQFGEELQLEIEREFLDAIEPKEEKEIDIDYLIAENERKNISVKKLNIAQAIDKILEKGKLPTEYNQQEKYTVINKIRSLKENEIGIFCRKTGIQSQHIKLWEEELLGMAKKEIDQNDKIQKLELENKKLQKQLKESEREKKELKILIDLKKKYQNLFKEGEES